MITSQKSPWILVTGAAGFIGSAYLREALAQGRRIVVLDALTYAGHLGNIQPLLAAEKCEFIKGDIGDFDLVSGLFEKYLFQAVVHFAAESHVDNSISGPWAFVKTNIIGTFNLLEVSRKHWSAWGNRIETADLKKSFRFVHVSTDEVYGELGPEGMFSENSPLAPNSPYSASKASSDMLVRAWHHTYGLPTITTNCSNNYGPRQFPEKLIPRMIVNALKGEALPVYGKGANVRDWIHVEDHARGVHLALEKGKIGETYCFGGNSERANLKVVELICHELDQKIPRKEKKSYREQIQFVTDRLGHDFRYAIDDNKAQRELGFARKYLDLESGLKQTVAWYLENAEWLAAVADKQGK